MQFKSFRPRLLAIVFSTLLALALFGLLFNTVKAQSPEAGGATLSFKGPAGPITVGDEISITVFLSDVVDLYGIQLDLGFTAADLAVIDENGGQPGVQILPGVCPAPDFLLENTADNSLGTIDYAVSQLSPTLPVNGDCAVAFIRFETLQAVTTTLTFGPVVLADSNGEVIPVTKVDLTLAILPPAPTADFSASPTIGGVPLPVTFTNLSSGVYNSCLWDFGDGNSSSLCADPSHTYQAVGSYGVSLTVTGPGGSSSQQFSDYIVVLGGEKIYLPVVRRE